MSVPDCLLVPTLQIERSLHTLLAKGLELVLCYEQAPVVVLLQFTSDFVT